MPNERVILVTGVAGYLGGRVAAALTNLPGMHVIGLDVAAPAAKIPGLDFIRADLRSALLPELLQDEGIDTLVHLAFIESERPNEHAFDVNVNGTINLMGACAAAGVGRAVLCSSTVVYGARPDNSAFLTEDHPLHGSERWGTVRDLAEIESFCRGFTRQEPRMAVTLLRFAHMLGPAVDSPLTRFLREMWTPTLLGFDPMMQVIHEDDVVRALLHAVHNEIPGAYNVAADDPLPLTQLMALAAKLPVPLVHVGVYLGLELARGTGLDVTRYVPIDPDYLRYGCVGDLERMRQLLGFAPQYTAAEALREFGAQQRLARFLPEQAAAEAEEKRLRETIERRRRVRAQGAGATPALEDILPENGDSGAGGEREADD